MAQSKPVMITSDSTTDLGEMLINRYGIKILPLGVVLGDKVYADGIDITPDDIYAYHDRTGQLAKTTATNQAEHLQFFKQFTDEGYAVVHFTISSGFSSTYANACLAAEELPDVHVVDTQNLSTGGGLLVVAAAELAKSGKDAAEIAEAVREIVPNVDASFVVDNLEYLHKGGRCSAVAALGANLLRLKPCIEVKNGKMGVGKKYRGKYDAVLREYVAERLADQDDIQLDRVFVTHAGCDPKLVEEIAALVKKTLPFEEVLVTRAGATISAHCGANTLGVLFIRKTPLK